jgi:hypothetical protein
MKKRNTSDANEMLMSGVIEINSEEPAPPLSAPMEDCSL